MLKTKNTAEEGMKLPPMYEVRERIPSNECARNLRRSNKALLLEGIFTAVKDQLWVRGMFQRLCTSFVIPSCQGGLRVSAFLLMWNIFFFFHFYFQISRWLFRGWSIPIFVPSCRYGSIWKVGMTVCFQNNSQYTEWQQIQITLRNTEQSFENGLSVWFSMLNLVC